MLDKIISSETFVVKGKVERFTGKAAWFYIKVPKKHNKYVKSFGGWRFVAIDATCGDTDWQTSLLPFGDGTFFIALKKSVRIAEGIMLGDTVKVKFGLRER